MMQSRVCQLFLFLLAAPQLAAWSSSTTRKAFFTDVAAATAGILLVPAAANAEILETSKAWRNIKSAQKRFKEFKGDYVDTANYEDLRQSLRAAPVSDLRKSCGALLKVSNTVCFFCLCQK
jgi:ADP-ribosylglycohydrolase